MVLLTSEVEEWLAGLVKADPQTARAFDPRRQAVLLVAGDKSRDWKGWYASAIRRAESLYQEHLRMLRREDH